MLLNYLVRRPFYAPDGGASGSGAPDSATVDQPEQPPAEVSKTEPAQEHMIPKSRFDEVNQKLQALQAEQQKREAAEKAKAEKDAAARGEWERLATERQAKLEAAEQGYTTAQAQIVAYEAEMERQIKVRLKGLPEEIRAMKPDADPLTVYAWLEKAETAAVKLTAAPPPPRPPVGTPAGPRGPGSATTTHTPDLVANKRAGGEYGI